MNFSDLVSKIKGVCSFYLMNISIIVLLYETEHAGSLPFIDIHIKRLLKNLPWLETFG